MTLYNSDNIKRNIPLVAALILAMLPSYPSQTTVLTSAIRKHERTSSLYRGDFIIGALYSLHHQPRQKKTGAPHFLECGEIREDYGIQRAEVTFQTLDRINADPSLLPNITLGAEIRDSCWYAPVALQQTIEFIRDSILPASSTSPCTAGSSVQVRTGDPTDPVVSRGTLIGVVGPGSSSVAMQVQNLLQLFGIPQVAYSATSRDLSDKARFSSFMRVVPSDHYQAKVLLDIVMHHNWTYVSAVNTDENYGQSGIQAFRELAEGVDVCIAKEASVLSNAADEDFEAVIRTLRQDRSARVVVCFCEGMTVRGLLAADQRLNLTDRLLIVGSDGWADRSDVVKDYELQAHGSLSIRIHSPHVRSFDDYYLALQPHTNRRNPWFPEFWQMRFNCSLQPNGTRSGKLKRCTGHEKLSPKYGQDPKMSLVIKALYTMAYGLHDMVTALCGGRGSCPALFPFNGELFKSYLMNVSFTTADGEKVEFDRHGDPPGRYEIMNFQQLPNGSFDYVHVGDWMDGALSFKATLQYGPHSAPPKSVCSKPCDPGYYKNFQTGGQEKRCCWACVPCDPREVLLNDTTCQACERGWYPAANKTVCEKIPEERMQWSDGQAIVAMCFSCLGFCATALTAFVFIRHNHTPVVKSSTRELSYLILAGMTLSHAATFPILAKPGELTCALSRTMPGISFAMIYASLLTKTNRIARILAGSKKRFPTRKPRFMSGTAQVVISCSLIGIEVGISILMLIQEPPRAGLQFPTFSRAILACDTSPRGVLAPLAFDFLLIALCTLYAVKTRNVPENFNEAKFIGFAMYTTCVIWVAFVPIYFGSESKIITMCMCVTLSAMVTLIFLFMPKLYIIVFQPERNNRALFTTSKSIRCHIGSRVASALAERGEKPGSRGSEGGVSRSSQGEGGVSRSSQGEGGTSRSSQGEGGVFKSSQGEGVVSRSSQGEGIKPKLANRHSVNWPDDPKRDGDIPRKKPEFRTLSCQTSNDLTQFVFQAQKVNVSVQGCPAKELPSCAELDPKALLDSHHKNCSPNMSVKSLNPHLLRTKQTSTPLLHPKARIREESISECSLSDEDMTQIKSITITLGSTHSVNNHVCVEKENGLCPVDNVDSVRLRKTTSESPISSTKVGNNHNDSNGLSNSTF